MLRFTQFGMVEETARTRELVKRAQSAVPDTSDIVKCLLSSPETAERYLEITKPTDHAHLSSKQRVQIALCVSQANRSRYCIARYAKLARDMNFSDELIRQSRLATIDRHPERELLNFATQLIAFRGQVSDNDLNVLRNVGVKPVVICELTFYVSTICFENMITGITLPEMFFPDAEPL